MLTKNPMTPVERRAIGALALLYSFRMLGLFMVLPLLALYAVDMPGGTPLMIGLALGAYGFSQALLQIPLGWLSDRIGRTPVILGGLLMFAAGSLVAGLAETVPGIVVGRLLQGAGAIAGTVMALVADVTDDEQRTKAMAIVGASIGLSFAVSLVLGPVVAGFGGLSSVFLLTAVLAVSGIAVVFLGIPRGVQSRAHTGVGTRPDMIRSVLAEPALRRLNFGVFSLHFILTASFLVIPFALLDTLSLPREAHWKVYLPVLLASLIGMLPLLRLAERHGRVRSVLVSTVVMLLVSIAGMTLLAVPWVLWVALWLYFVAVNYLEATLPSLVSKAVFSGGKGTALGVYSTFQFIGAFTGGACGGLALQYGGVPGLFLLCLIPGVFWVRSSLGVSASPPPATQGVTTAS
ncbi:MAG: MFS transporter [Chromatocurvus sp.]